MLFSNWLRSKMKIVTIKFYKTLQSYKINLDVPIDLTTPVPTLCNKNRHLKIIVSLTTMRQTEKSFFSLWQWRNFDSSLLSPSAYNLLKRTDVRESKICRHYGNGDWGNRMTLKRLFYLHRLQWFYITKNREILKYIPLKKLIIL